MLVLVLEFEFVLVLVIGACCWCLLVLVLELVFVLEWGKDAWRCISPSLPSIATITLRRGLVMALFVPRALALNIR